MAVTVTYYPESVLWNSVTYSCTEQGIIQVNYEHSGSPIEDRTGCDEYPTSVIVVDKGMRVTMRLRTVKQTTALGVKSNLVATLKTKSGGTSVLTFPGMVLVDVRGQQPRAGVGDVEMVFVHESADGTTVPIS